MRPSHVAVLFKKPRPINKLAITWGLTGKRNGVECAAH